MLKIITDNLSASADTVAADCCTHHSGSGTWIDVIPEMTAAQLIEDFQIKCLRLRLPPAESDGDTEDTDVEERGQKTMSSIEFLQKFKRKYVVLPAKK